MIKIAILGGTRFFGKYLVDNLLEDKNNSVDVYSRSGAKFKIERSNKEDLEKIFLKKYDIIIDNICFGSSDALLVNEIFSRHKDLLPKQYVFTSTSFVYKGIKNTSLYDETLKFIFDEVSNKKYPEIDYALGKKESEYVFLNGVLSDRMLIIRPPYMIGKDDHTNRLNTMFEKVKNYSSIEINKNDLFPMSFVDVKLLSNVIVKFILDMKHGIFNVSNSGCLSNKEIYQLIGNSINKKIDFLIKKDDKLLNPYSLKQSLCLDISKLNREYDMQLNSVEKSIISIVRCNNEKN